MNNPFPQVDAALKNLRGAVLSCPHKPDPKQDLIVVDSNGVVQPFVVARSSLEQFGAGDPQIRWVLTEVEKAQASDPKLLDALPVAIVTGDTTSLLFVTSTFEMLAKGGVS